MKFRLELSCFFLDAAKADIIDIFLIITQFLSVNELRQMVTMQKATNVT